MKKSKTFDMGLWMWVCVCVAILLLLFNFDEVEKFFGKGSGGIIVIVGMLILFFLSG